MIKLLLRTSKEGKLVIFLVVLACAGISTIVQIWNAHAMANVLKMTEQTKTVCVGRLLIDVPADAQITLFGDRLDGFKIESVVENEAAFLQREVAREREISEPNGEGDASKKGMVQARDLRVPALPPTPGFCTERAVFVDPLPPHKTEHVAMHIGFVDHPDIALAFFTLPGGGKNAHGLLMRHAEMDAMAGADELLRVTTLRSGSRDINGLRGEEVLERVREFNLAITYGFMWEAPGVSGDPLRPFLSLELQGGVSLRPGGKPVDSSLRQDAVLALWDRISSSIRPQSPPPPAISTARR